MVVYCVTANVLRINLEKILYREMIRLLPFARLHIISFGCTNGSNGIALKVKFVPMSSQKIKKP